MKKPLIRAFAAGVLTTAFLLTGCGQSPSEVSTPSHSQPSPSSAKDPQEQVSAYVRSRYNDARIGELGPTLYREDLKKLAAKIGEPGMKQLEAEGKGFRNAEALVRARFQIPDENSPEGTRAMDRIYRVVGEEITVYKGFGDPKTLQNEQGATWTRAFRQQLAEQFPHSEK